MAQPAETNPAAPALHHLPRLKRLEHISSPHASVPPERRAQHGTLPHWELLTLAALGATFGFLTGTGLWSEIHLGSLDFALWSICSGLAAYVLYDPGMEALQDWLGIERLEAPENRKKFALVIAALATMLVSAFHGSLENGLAADLHEFADKLEKLQATSPSNDPFEKAALDLMASVTSLGGWGLLLLVLVSVGAVALAVTHSWVLGSKRSPRRAVHLGTGVSFLLGLVIAVILVRYLVSKDLLHALQWKLLVGLLILLWFLGPGALGGLAIHKVQSGSCPTRGILWHFVLFSAAFVFLLLISARIFVSNFPRYKDTVDSLAWLPIAALIFQNLGWSLGLFFRHKSCDPYLGGSCAATVEEHPSPEPKFAGVVPFPSQRDSAPPAQPEFDDSLTPAARVQILLLKPKGDRLWAAVALVLALITAGLAYYAGTLRRDPELINDIEARLRQDSGLQNKALSLQSAGRVVTLAGVVDNETEHEKAVREASSVRGVKQVIDRIQVAPAMPPLPAATETAPPAATKTEPPPSAEVVPVPQPPSAINPPISIGASAGPGDTASGNTSATGHQKTAQTPSSSAAQKQGFLHNLTKNKNTPARAPATQKQAASSKTASAPNQSGTPAAAENQKHGFFHFLRKNKDNNNNNKTNPNNLKTNNPKANNPKSNNFKNQNGKTITKKDASH